MFSLIHGEDQVKTRLELLNQISTAKKSGVTDVVTFTDKTLTLELLIQNIESLSMFGDLSRLVVLENIHKKRSKTELKEIINYLSLLDPKSVNLIIWEDHDLTPGQQKSLSNAKNIQLKLSASIFKLTDALIPHAKTENVLKLLQDACLKDSPEMVITMLARQLRLMIQTFDPNAKIAPWQKAKLSSAARAFGLNQLIEFHRQLADIDFNNKTGKLPSDLKSELEFWLIKIYRKN